MRIIAGEARSRQIDAPKGRDTRPTLDRVRENLFNIIAREVPGARVLDLFAGSGALSLEALSRGAALAVMVDRAREVGAETLAVVAHGGTQMAVLERYGRPRKPFWSWMTGPGQGYLLTDRDWPVELTPLELLDFTEGPP